MRGIAVFSAIAVLGCKHHQAPRDAPLPHPGASRGTFGLTYYWPDGKGGSAYGVQDRELVPYRSIAVDRSVIPIGTHLWVEQLANVPEPDGGVINGCVLADDVGGKIVGNKIDFFVPSEAAYAAIDHALKLTSVTIYDGGDMCP